MEGNKSMPARGGTIIIATERTGVDSTPVPDRRSSSHGQAEKYGVAGAWVGVAPQLSQKVS